jgi:hypothetical protein
MKILKIRLLPICFIVLVSSCTAQKEKTARIQLVQNAEEQKVDVLIDGQLFTSYIYPSTIKKPVLYPLITPKGTKITRKFPLEASIGERADHPHHVGVWFNYGDVNGLDFWNNSDSIPVEKREHYGTIVHKEIISAKDGDDEAQLEVAMDWVSPSGEVLLKENTTFVFKGAGDEYSIDRITKLTAANGEVNFNDNKEGVLGIRLTREMELPSDKPDIFTDANGIATTVKVLNNEGVNGNYLNAEGVEGLDCWGLRSDWMNLSSKMAILDHKNNVGYPTYWHARGYGLFAANPLGQAVFSDGKETLDFKLNANESTTFKHRIILSNKNLNSEILNAKFAEFSAE